MWWSLQFWGRWWWEFVKINLLSDGDDGGDGHDVDDVDDGDGDGDDGDGGDVGDGDVDNVDDVDDGFVEKDGDNHDQNYLL